MAPLLFLSDIFFERHAPPRPLLSRLISLSLNYLCSWFIFLPCTPAMARLLPLALLAAAAFPSALAGVQEYWWNITYVEDINPDGLFPRRVIGVNGTWP